MGNYSTVELPSQPHSTDRQHQSFRTPPIAQESGPSGMTQGIPEYSTINIQDNSNTAHGESQLTPAPLGQNSESPHARNINAPSTASPVANSPAVSIFSKIGSDQPLAHDVGLLSLANSAEPKYLGPSSGVAFARLIFAAAPQAQGLSSNIQVPETANNGQNNPAELAVKLADLPPDGEMRYFADAYFETWHPLYPFLSEEVFQEMVSRIQSQRDGTISDQSQDPSRFMDLAQLFLIIALGAKVLESRLSADFASESYYATAMSHVANVQLHDSIRGVQVLLLLVLSSFSFTNGLNAWFLTSTILASCLDLGLQRKHIDGMLSLPIVMLLYFLRCWRLNLC